MGSIRGSVKHGVMGPVLEQLKDRPKLSMMRKATWTLSKLCDDASTLKVVRPALATLVKLMSSVDEEVGDRRNSIAEIQGVNCYHATRRFVAVVVQVWWSWACRFRSFDPRLQPLLNFPPPSLFLIVGKPRVDLCPKVDSSLLRHCCSRCACIERAPHLQKRRTVK